MANKRKQVLPYFKIKKAMRDKERQYMMIKETFYQEDITLINICELNTGARKYIKQLLTNIKEDINNNTIIVEDLNTPLTPMDKSSRQKVNKKIVELNEKLDQMDFIDIYRTLHPITAGHTFISIAHGIFSRINHMLGNKASLNKFKRVEMISSIFPDHSAMKLEFDYKNKAGQGAKMWRLNNTILNDHWIIEDIRRNQLSGDK